MATTTHDAAVALATEVVRFLADPDLDRIRPADQESALYLSWDQADPTTPHLSLIVTLDDAVVAEAGQLLTAKGVALDVSDRRPTRGVVEGAEVAMGDDGAVCWPDDVPGRWFQVPLTGPAYAGLLTESALRAAPLNRLHGGRS